MWRQCQPGCAGRRRKFQACPTPGLSASPPRPLDDESEADAGRLEPQYPRRFPGVLHRLHALAGLRAQGAGPIEARRGHCAEIA
jgi:hypothetical protein